MSSVAPSTVDHRAATRAMSIRLACAWVLLPAFFLATGGSLGWWQAWIYCALVLAPMTVFVVRMVSRDPEFIARRMKMKEKEAAQRRLLAWGQPLLLAVFVLPGLDHRFGWSAIPAAVAAAAMALAFVAYLAILRVFAENRWAGRTIETSPGQAVVSTGPYSVVRHPMYAASIILYAASSVALGSWWALLASLAAVPVCVLRIRNEEEVLARDLAGYDEYRRRVRYRLLPGVW